MAERIVVDQVVKTFGAHVALDGVSFDVEPGKFLVLLGPSGSGKTTLVRCLAGIERITSGRIALGGTTVADGDFHYLRASGPVDGLSALRARPTSTPSNNVAFALRRSRTPKASALVLATEMLERVGLASHGDRYPSQLSGGEQQRVALARALIGGTGLLLFDEPLSNLDADLRERMRIEIASLVRSQGPARSTSLMTSPRRSPWPIRSGSSKTGSWCSSMCLRRSTPDPRPHLSDASPGCPPNCPVGSSDWRGHPSIARGRTYQADPASVP